MTVINYYEYSAKVQDVYDLLDIIFCTFHPDNLRIYRGWEFWQKHQHLFPSQNYAFVKVKNFVDNDYAAILFVNKKAFLKIVSKYITDFKNILGADVTPQLLLEKVLHGDDVFGDVLKHHQGLIGTLLGFGRDNAWLFHEREEISYYKGNPSPLLGESSYVFKKLPSQTSQEVLSAFNRRLQSFDDRSSLHFHPLLMRLPSFAADPATIETKQLKINYQQQYHQIVQRYKEGDFLEITLKQITSKPGLWES
ncbi:MAG: hypothetical protein FJZ63_05045 [Chlamydiae bacterium]|nr:hypothetical protein [Chlamydiota bacterium]